MDDLIQGSLTGPELVRAVRAMLPPGSSIDTILDMTREVNLKRQAIQLECENVFDLFDRVHTLDLAPEDTWRLFELVATNSDGHFSDEIAKHAGVMLDNGMLRLALSYTRPVHVESPPPPSCWCFTLGARRNKTAPRSPQTSPGTGK